MSAQSQQACIPSGMIPSAVYNTGRAHGAQPSSALVQRADIPPAQPMAFYPPFQRRYQELVRARQITEVLVRNGLGFLVEQLALSRFLPAWGRRRILGPSEEIEQRSIPERLRLTLE